MRFRYALFDLDGTLTDPKEGITKSVQFALNRQGIREPDLDKLEPFIGPPLLDSFMEFYGMTQEEAALAVSDYRRRFAPVGIFENKVYPAVPELLAHLREAGMRLAVASSKPEPFVRQILEHFSLDGYFDVVAGSDPDGGCADKAEVIEEVLRRFEALSDKENDMDVVNSAKRDAARRIDRDMCVMIGDRKFDVRGAKECGLAAVGVSYGYAGKGELEQAGADYIAKSPKSVEKYLIGRRQGGKKADGTGQAYTQAGGERTAAAEERDAKSPFLKTWHILFPFLLYYLGYHTCYIVFVTAVQLLLGAGERIESWLYENSTALTNAATACSMLAGAGVVFPLFRRERTKRPAAYGRSYLTVGVLAGTAAVGLNILFGLLKITSLSAGYTEVQQRQYQVPFVYGILLYGLISPLAEEILFRGLIYNRMKRYFPAAAAGVVSSALFGAYHGNVPQTLYGTLLGLLIVYAYEMTGDFKTAVFAHAVANCVVFTLTYDSDVWISVCTPINCAIFMTISILSFFNMQKRKRSEGRV